MTLLLTLLVRLLLTTNIPKRQLTFYQDFCSTPLRQKVVSAYNQLWDTIEANTPQLSHEVWTWEYSGGKYAAVPLGAVTSTESNVRQLWSLTFLGVGREKF